MRAHPGDHLLIEGTKVGAHRRDGRIVACQGAEGGPPFLVHWNDTGAESLVFPGPDAHITTTDAGRRGDPSEHPQPTA